MSKPWFEPLLFEIRPVIFEVLNRIHTAIETAKEYMKSSVMNNND